MLFPRKAHRGTVFGVAHRGTTKIIDMKFGYVVINLSYSRCALWSRLDQRASLPPLCVGLRVSRRGAPPGISSGFAQFTPKKGPKIGHFWGFPRPPTRLNTLRRVKPSGLKPANLYSTKCRFFGHFWRFWDPPKIRVTVW